jgi:ribonucleoside-diphosphate reductase alpha chain
MPMHSQPRVAKRSPDRGTPFVDAAAAEAWDAWFRWRDDEQVHDVFVDATHMRVAHALAVAEPSNFAGLFQKSLMDACSSWQLLLDEHLLTTAGTDRPQWADHDLAAVLNAALFVRNRFSGNAHFDHGAFAETAALAVWALDNALALATTRSDHGRTRLRIGLVGLADALAFLGLSYDTPSARAEAHAIAQSLAEGCYRQSIRLACDRGANGRLAAVARLQPMMNSLPLDLVREAERHGVRHLQLTAITSQKRLALLANNVADAVDPLRGPDHLYMFGAPENPRALRSSGYAMTAAREKFAPAPIPSVVTETLNHIPAQAQIELRGAMQVWIDCPISYPIVVAEMPDADSQQGYGLLASTRCLGKLSFDPIEKACANGSRQ